MALTAYTSLKWTEKELNNERFFLCFQQYQRPGNKKVIISQATYFREGWHLMTGARNDGRCVWKLSHSACRCLFLESYYIPSYTCLR